MVQSRDVIASIILISALFYFLYRGLLKKADKAKELGDEDRRSAKVNRRPELEKILIAKGYEWVQSSDRKPVIIRYGEKEVTSHFHIDGQAKKDHQLFVVKRKRKVGTTRMSGVSIRRELFPLYLLYQVDGILFVDTDNGRVTTILFDVEQPKLNQGNSLWRTRILWLIFGVIIGISIILSGKS